MELHPVSGYGDERVATCMPGFRATEEELTSWVDEYAWTTPKKARRSWERTVEENVRMLSGRQWDVFVESMNEFVDVSQYFGADEERWRQFPVFNWLSHYFRVNLSRITENIPVVAGSPTQPDHESMQLAEIWDRLWKFQWRQMDLPELYPTLLGWTLTAGLGVIKSVWDPSRGPAEDFVGDLPAGTLEMAPGQMYDRELADVPYILEDGQVKPGVTFDERGQPQMAERPYRHTLGDLRADVPNPLSVLYPRDGQPLWRKAWYTHRYLMHVDEARRIYDMPGLEPEVVRGEDDLMLKLEFGSHYGLLADTGDIGEAPALADNVVITEHWRAAVPNHAELHHGRLTVVAGEKRLFDGRNPFVVDGTQERALIPFYFFPFPMYPFRDEGTTDLENLTAIARALNRSMGAFLQAADRNNQPLKVIDINAEIDDDTDFNEPGAEIRANRARSPHPVEYVSPPPIPASTLASMDVLLDWLMRLGHVGANSEGAPVTDDASGELQRQTRFDTDRPWGLLLRSHSYTWSRLAADLVDILSVTWPDERIVDVTGEDMIPQFLTVRKDVFKGRLRFEPSPESAVLESRQDKQNRLVQAFTTAATLPPELASQYLQSLNYPDLARITRPGGAAYSRVQREHLELYLGSFPAVLREHDHAFDLGVHRKEQQSLQYRNADPRIQGLFRQHVLMHELAMAAEQQRQTMAAADMAEAKAGVVAPVVAGASRRGIGPGGRDPRSVADQREGADPSGAPTERVA